MALLFARGVHVTCTLSHLKFMCAALFTIHAVSKQAFLENHNVNV